MIPSTGRTRPPSAPAANAPSSLEHKADAAHALNQLRLTQLPPQVRHVTVDDVRARSCRISPHALQRLVSAHHTARIAQEQLEQIRLTHAQRDPLASPPCTAGLDVEDEITERE